MLLLVVRRLYSVCAQYSFEVLVKGSIGFVACGVVAYWFWGLVV